MNKEEKRVPCILDRESVLDELFVNDSCSSNLQINRDLRQENKGEKKIYVTIPIIMSNYHPKFNLLLITCTTYAIIYNILRTVKSPQYNYICKKK